MSTRFKHSLRRLQTLKYSGLSLLLMSGSTFAADFVAGDFTLYDWQRISVVEDGSAAIFTLHASGGHPDQYWLAEYTLPASSAPVNTRLRMANINTMFSYDTASQGPLQTIDFQMDLRGFSATLNVAGYYRPAILQGGQLYVVDDASRPVMVGDWTTEYWHFDASTQWVTMDGQVSPGFGAGAGVLNFGYMFGLSSICSNASGCLAARSFSGLDNYQVTLNAVPEPQTNALWLAGLGLLALFARASRPRIHTTKGPHHA
jgi:hypothetical protein